jgi:hypothetical protein
MSVRIGHLSLVTNPLLALAPARPDAVSVVTADDIPASPPPEVLDAVGLAAQHAQALRAADRELHFATDPSSGRIVVELRDLAGMVVRTLPPSGALDIVSGLSGP